MYVGYYLVEIRVDRTYRRRTPLLLRVRRLLTLEVEALQTLRRARTPSGTEPPLVLLLNRLYYRLAPVEGF